MPSNLPPGVTNSMIDPPAAPCEVCGIVSDDCICPECPVCQDFGNPACYQGPTKTYQGHGLVRSKAQVISLTKFRIGQLEEGIRDENMFLSWLEERPDTWTEADDE